MRFGTKVLIKLKNLENNFKKLKEIAPRNQVIFMIKADAYGHGIKTIHDYAVSKLGIHEFGVASLGEAIFLRKESSFKESKLYVFSDHNLEKSDCLKHYQDGKIIPVISSIEDLNLYINNQLFESCALVIKFNTGMNRIGIAFEDLSTVFEILSKHNIKKVNHLMTHFMSSYLKLKQGDHTSRQFNLFQEIKAQFKLNGIEVECSSCANSGAIEQGIGLDETHIRPGLMLYGPYSVGGYGEVKKIWDADNLSSLEVRVINRGIRKKGDPIGYGGFVLDKDYLILTLALGYGDGFLTYYSGAKIKIENFEAKILGRVNMDMVLVGLDIKNSEYFKDHKTIKLWTFDQDTIADFSAAVKTIPYQVFTAITSRVTKEYILE